MHTAETEADGQASRPCAACRELKAIAHFHLKGRNRAGQPRFHSFCKDCANEQRVARYKRKIAKKEKRPSLRERSAIGQKKFDVTTCQVAIVAHERSGASRDMKSLIGDYIEVVYAISSKAVGF